MSREPGAPLRYVREPSQGIPFARNRAIEECKTRDYMLFMDDDELPRDGLLTAALDALEVEGAECAGGRVQVAFRTGERPTWLGDELLGFLAEIDYGEEPFWIEDTSTPIWTANVAYRMELFVNDPQLRFDPRYNRVGKGVGGGEDAVLFREMVNRGVRIRYRPDMLVEHHVDAWRLKRRYFLQLHYIGGRKFGEYEASDYSRSIGGVPPFLVAQTARYFWKTLQMWAQRRPGVMRQAMNAAYSLGAIHGRVLRWRSSKFGDS